MFILPVFWLPNLVPATTAPADRASLSVSIFWPTKVTPFLMFAHSTPREKWLPKLPFSRLSHSVSMCVLLGLLSYFPQFFYIDLSLNYPHVCELNIDPMSKQAGDVCL